MIAGNKKRTADSGEPDKIYLFSRFRVLMVLQPNDGVDTMNNIYKKIMGGCESCEKTTY